MFFFFEFFCFSKGIKRVYIGSQLIYAIGMLLMGYLRHRIAVIILSAVAGILYSTLFTIPYLLISKYHSSNTVCYNLFPCEIKLFIQ
jgi:solute carrier family 45 protein 1/2/4